MSKIRTGLIAVTGLAVGIVALRSVRKRRATPRDEAETAVKDAIEETEQAVDHASAAAGHTRTAGEKAVESAREKLDTTTTETNDGDPAGSGSVGRLRRVGKGLIRR